MVIVRVEGYDCCALTHSIWINTGMCKKEARLWHENSKNLNFGDDRTADKLIEYLSLHGFRKVDAKTISFGGNY